MLDSIHRIMVLDDEDDYHLITRLVLKRVGYTGELIAFDAPESAMDHLTNDTPPPDLLLVDINMPGTTGFEFVEQCTRNKLIHEETTVIMCSSSNRPLDIRTANAMGAVHGYVEKAIDENKLQRIIETHHERQRN